VIVSKESKANREEKIILRDLARGENQRELDIKLPEPRFWTVGPRAEWFAIVDPRPNNRRVRVLEGNTGAERFARDFEANVLCLAAARGGDLLAVGLTEPGRGANNKVVLLDTATGERLSVLPTQKRGPAALAFSEDGRHLAVAFHGLVQVWDVRARELVRTIAGFERVITCLTFNAAGNVLAAGTQDGQVWLWATTTGKPMQLIEVGSRGVRTVAFSPDGRRLVALANTAPVGVWEVADVPTDAAFD
jgi:dipeptidyl aminopeptidase/acylaminoacyl peptidase